jgi:D-3-phosphoglycerate dehydrogenase
VILTPHVASGTEEAQEAIGRFVGKKLVSFINEGSTALSVNMPALGLPEQAGSHRLILIHQNVPGVLAKVNGLMADKGVNIDGQYLGTNGPTAYVITDINAKHEPGLISALREMPETIKLRILY